jgi:hypothetical protein
MSSNTPNPKNQNRPVVAAVVDLARDRLTDHLRAERRAGRTVLTLVEVSQVTALDPRTVEAVMERLVEDPEYPVRRSTTDPHRWYL